MFLEHIYQRNCPAQEKTLKFDEVSNFTKRPKFHSLAEKCEQKSRIDLSQVLDLSGSLSRAQQTYNFSVASALSFKIFGDRYFNQKTDSIAI